MRIVRTYETTVRVYERRHGRYTWREAYIILHVPLPSDLAGKKVRVKLEITPVEQPS